MVFLHTSLYQSFPLWSRKYIEKLSIFSSRTFVIWSLLNFISLIQQNFIFIYYFLKNINMFWGIKISVFYCITWKNRLSFFFLSFFCFCFFAPEYLRKAEFSTLIKKKKLSEWELKCQNWPIFLYQSLMSIVNDIQKSQETFTFENKLLYLDNLSND